MTSALEPAVGQMVAEKYRLTKLLGRGGMGSVWEGVHATLGTRVAVKFIEPEFAKQAEVRERFVNEALAAARLQSKHIVQVFDHDLTEEGAPYIVMEYLSGEALDARLVREGALALEDTAPLMMQLCRAMHRAHTAGIIHRDLKPDNVFLVWDEEDHEDLVKVVDFGIAKFTEGTGIDSKTTTGAVMGTPHYMSPEQARGLRGVDARSDVWSIGVITYRAVTGVLPFDGQAVGDLLVKICTQEPVPASDLVPVPSGFDEWIAKSLAKEPASRFASAEEQGRALGQLLGLEVATAVERPGSSGVGTSSRNVNSNGTIGRLDTAAGLVTGSGRKRANPAWGLLGLLLLGSVGVGAWFFTRLPEPEAATSLQPEPDIAGESMTVAPEREPVVTPSKIAEPERIGLSEEEESNNGSAGGPTQVVAPGNTAAQVQIPKTVPAAGPLRKTSPKPQPAPRPPVPARPKDELGY